MSTRRSFQITHRHYQVHCCVYSQEIEEWKKQSLRQKLDVGQAIIVCISKTWSETQFRNFSFDIWRMMLKQGNNVQITRWCAALGINTTFNALLFQVEAERSWSRYDENKLRTTQEEGEGEGGQWDSEISKTEWRSKIERARVTLRRTIRDGAPDAHPSPSHVPWTPDTCNR